MRTQGALTALVMLAVTLTGCTDTTAAPPPPTLGATTSPTPSPSPSPHTHSAGGQFEYTDVLTLDHRQNQYAVLLQLVQHPSQTVGPDGTVLEDFPDTLTTSADMLVAWRDGGWKVDSVVFDLHRRERL